MTTAQPSADQYSPIDRLAWSRAVHADQTLRPSALRVAAFLADVAGHHGESWYTAERIAVEMTMPLRNVKAGLYQLAACGWTVTPGGRSPGRRATVYRLTRDRITTVQSMARLTVQPVARLDDGNRAVDGSQPCSERSPTMQQTVTNRAAHGTATGKEQGKNRKSRSEAQPTPPPEGGSLASPTETGKRRLLAMAANDGPGFAALTAGRREAELLEAVALADPDKNPTRPFPSDLVKGLKRLDQQRADRAQRDRDERDRRDEDLKAKRLAADEPAQVERQRHLLALVDAPGLAVRLDGSVPERIASLRKATSAGKASTLIYTVLVKRLEGLGVVLR